MLGAAFVSAAAASEANDRVLIEEAWIIANPEGAALAYIVINNRSGADVVLRSVSSPVAGSTRLLTPRGAEFPRGATIPVHAELYMMPGGVRVALDNLATPLIAGQMVPLTLRLVGDFAASVEALVLEPGSAPPEHSNYKH